MVLLKFFHDPLALSDPEFNLLLAILTFFMALPLIFIGYLIVMAAKIEFCNEEQG